MAYGRTVLSQNTIFPTRVSADGNPKYKPGGVTIDWALVTAVSSDTTLTDGSIILNGQKYLRYGQVICKVTASGKFAPYDPSLTNGQELLVRGNTFILDETLPQYGSGSPTLVPSNDQTGGAFDAGLVFIDRVLNSGVATHTLALGPTLAEVLTVFPGLLIARD